MSLQSSGACQLGQTAAGTTAANALAIQAGVSYVQVSTCAITAIANNNYAIPGVVLPASSQAGQVITIRNDGAGLCAIWPNAAGTAAINSQAAGVPWFVAANGGIVSLLSGPSLQWYVILDTGLKVFSISTNATALTELPAWNDAILEFPAMAGACTVTLLAPAQGNRFKAVMTGTAANAISFTSTAANQYPCCQVDVTGATACLCTNVAATQTTVRFAAVAIAGDYLQFQATDVLWSVQGFGRVANCFTVA